MVGYIRIGNKRNKNTKIAPNEVMVGVDKGTDLYNPFSGKIKVEPEDRDKACDDYEALAESDMRRRGPIYRAIMTLADRVLNGENLVLMCWCVPRRCHAMYVKTLIEREVSIRLGKTNDTQMQWAMPSRKCCTCS